MPNYRWLFHISSRVQPKPYTSNLSPLCYAVIEHTQYQARVKLTGSFRLSAVRGHLHPHCIFTELLPETVPQSLHLSCTSELTRQGISLNYSSKLDSLFIFYFYKQSDVWRWSLVNHNSNIFCLSTEVGSYFLGVLIRLFISHYYNRPSSSGQS